MATCLLWASAPAAQPAPEPALPAAESSPATTGATNRLAPPPGARRPRSFRECSREAQGRRLRGMERRRFVYRCQSGLGRALFRRRGPPAPPPGAPPPERPAPTQR